MMTAEQIVASHKANVETLFGLTAKAFEGVEKLVELNLTAAKAALAEKTAAYSRQLYDIASGTGGEFTKAFEAQAALAQKQFASLVDSASQNAPACSASAVAMMKSAVAAANNAFESVQKAVKQANDLAESNYAALRQNVSAATTKPSKKR